MNKMDKCCRKQAQEVSQEDLLEYDHCYGYDLTCTKCKRVWEIPITIELDLVYADEITVSNDIEDPSAIKVGDTLFTKSEHLAHIGEQTVTVHEVDHVDKGDGNYPLITYKGKDGRLETRTHKFFCNCLSLSI